MVDDKTTQSIFDPNKTLRPIRSHRVKPSYPLIRPVALLLVLVIAAPILVMSVLPLEAPAKPLSAPVTAQTYAPLTFPSPPYVEPSETRTATATRASRDTAQSERTQPPPVAPEVSKVEIVISFALAQVGKRYSFGTKGPNTYDCSGLLVAAFARIGMDLYHYTGRMMTYGKPVTRSQLQRGDIVFPSTEHVGIYLGDGAFVHASSGRGRVVVDSKIYSFHTARRLV